MISLSRAEVTQCSRDPSWPLRCDGMEWQSESSIGTRSTGSEQGRSGAADLAVVVISFRNEPGLVDAVRSLISQRPRPEMVVVNTGGGKAGATLAAAGIHVRSIECPEPLHPGAARNVGVRETTAPFVAFLAADCRAEPGWVAERLRRHRAGAAAVASVITNASPASASASAAHLLLYARRMASTSAAKRLLYGVSYARPTLERLGPFREDLRQDEDSELNRRLDATIEWAPGVRTAHRNPLGPWQLVRNQYARGRRSHIYSQLPMSAVLRIALFNRPMDAVRQGLRARESGDCGPILQVTPLLIAASLAYTLGLLRARRLEIGAGSRPALARSAR
jgi:Glycosyl transferase family 2